MSHFKVLVVDDDPEWGRIFKDDIEQAFVGTVWRPEIRLEENYHDGSEAIQQARPWHLLVTDVELDPTQGHKLGVRLCDLARRYGIPFVVVSGSPAIHTQDAADLIVKYGARDYLSKKHWNSNSDRLINDVREILLPSRSRKRGAVSTVTEARTVVNLDMRHYTPVSARVQEQAGAGGVASLVSQIQRFVDRGLEYVGLSRAEAATRDTGDGAMLVFERASQAHWFAEAFHSVAWKHNADLTDPTAKRWFRMGAATGEIKLETRADGSRDFAGGAIARAVRLEEACHAGSFLIDTATFSDLPKALSDRYDAEERIEIKGRIYRVRRYSVLPADTNPGAVAEQ